MCYDKVCVAFGRVWEISADNMIVNGILLHHNIEKQMSDSRGEVAYLMADISEVKEGEIRDLFQSLQELSCKYLRCHTTQQYITNQNQHVSAQEYCTSSAAPHL